MSTPIFFVWFVQIRVFYNTQGVIIVVLIDLNQIFSSLSNHIFANLIFLALSSQNCYINMFGILVSNCPIFCSSDYGVRSLWQLAFCWVELYGSSPPEKDDDGDINEIQSTVNTFYKQISLSLKRGQAGRNPYNSH